MAERDDRFDPERFVFRGLHPGVSIGTASDRYAGWIGQIYSVERYGNRVTKRTNRVGQKSFREEVLPVDSVREYFEHFRILEIDYTFYSTPLDAGGAPTKSFHTLAGYQNCMQEGDSVFLKVPRMICAQRILRAGSQVENEDFLNPRKFTEQFYQPAMEILGDRLGGFVFEQEYQRHEARLPLRELAGRLDSFFSTVPGDKRYHFELRTEEYLSAPVLEVFEKHGVGQILSHWTWLPTLQKQFARSGRRFLNSGKQALIRLMTPLGKRYEDAYAMAHPFDKLIDGMLQPRMIDETVALAFEGISRGVKVNVIINNRSGGNAPLIAKQIAMSFVQHRPANVPDSQA